MDIGTVWFESSTGKEVYPKHPDYSVICIEDIAHALANTCRFGGHCKEFYSVAQHSVLVAGLVPPRLALDGLMHDAAEAYLGDVVRPLKEHLEDYRELEYRWMAAIYLKLMPHLYTSILDVDRAIIKTADNDALMYEAWHLLPSRGDRWNIPVEEQIRLPWMAYDPKTAERSFLEMWYSLKC